MSTVPIKIPSTTNSNHNHHHSIVPQSMHHHHHNHHHNHDQNHGSSGHSSTASLSSSSASTSTCNHRVIRLKKFGNVPLGFSIRGGWEHGTGIFVSEVHTGSEAERQGLSAGDQILRVNGFNVDQASHDHVINLIKSSSKITIKVKSVGMIPIKSSKGDPLSWQVIKHGNNQADCCKTVPILSTFQPLMSKGQSSSQSAKLKQSKPCPVHKKYASSTGGSSRSITSSSHESGDESDYDDRYRARGNHQHQANAGHNQVIHREQQQQLNQRQQQQSNQIINELLLKNDQIIEEKVHVQLRNGQGLGCSVVRGPSAYPGIFVQGLKPNGAAIDAGLEIGDQIVGMNGFNFYPGHFDFADAIRKLKACQQMTLTIRKGIAVNLLTAISQQQQQQSVNGNGNNQSGTNVQVTSNGDNRLDSGTVTCYRCEDCYQVTGNGIQQLLRFNGHNQERNADHKSAIVSNNNKLVHKIKAIVHQEHNNNSDQNNSAADCNNGSSLTTDSDYQGDNGTCSNYDFNHHGPSITAADQDQRERISSSVSDTRQDKNNRLMDERRGQFKNVSTVIPDSEQSHGNHNHTVYGGNDVTDHDGHNEPLEQSINSVIQQPRCKLHPDRRNQKQTEVKMMATINHNQLIALESSVDLDPDGHDDVLERVRIEKEQIAIERKRLEEEQNQVRIQMEQLAIERKRLDMIKENQKSSDSDSINSNSTSRTITNGHAILSSTVSSLSSASSSSSGTNGTSSETSTSGTLTSMSNGMGFLDELKKLAQNRINPEGLLTDTLNKTNFFRDKSGEIVRNNREKKINLFPDDEKRKRHELLMEEFKSAHSKMFGKPNQEQLVNCDNHDQHGQLIGARVNVRKECTEENESCSSSTTSSSGVSSVSSASSSAAGVKKVVMFASDQQIIKSGLKRSAPIRAGQFSSGHLSNGQAPKAAVRTVAEKVTILRTSVSTKKPAPPPPPPLPPNSDADTDAKIGQRSGSGKITIRDNNSPLVTISSYNSQDHRSVINEPSVSNDKKVSMTSYNGNNNQIKPLSIRINCKLPDDE